MKVFFVFSLLICSRFGFSQSEADTLVFWEFAATLPVNEKGELQHDWGSETVHYLGNVKWISPSGKELELRIVSSYRRITEANGFKDQSVLALVKLSHVPVKVYDMVSRQNLPIGIVDNKLVYKVGASEISCALPAKLAERFCVDGLNCFPEAILVDI
jgi:hypothetical protein